jgi:hypothetical protein
VFNRLKVESEFECFVGSFNYLASQLSRHQFLEAVINEAVSETAERAKRLFSMYQHTGFQVNMDEMTRHVESILQDLQRVTVADHSATAEAPLTDSESVYPCLLIMMGSCHLIFKVNFYRITS